MKIIDKIIDKLVSKIVEKINEEFENNKDTKYCLNCEHNCGKFLEWINKDGKKELKVITYCSEFKQRKWE